MAGVVFKFKHPVIIALSSLIISHQISFTYWVGVEAFIM